MCEGYEFHVWIIKSDDYVYSNCEKQSNRSNKGLILLLIWQSIKHGFCYVLNRWLEEHTDKTNDWQEFDWELAKKIIETRDNPTTTIITLDTGEKCEVLTEINKNILKYKLSAEFAPCYRSHLILFATPNLRSLWLNIDAVLFPTPRFDDLLGLVPNLRSLGLYQCDSSQSNTASSHIPIRQTMKYLTELESLTINSFILNIQDLIDISSHPRLKYIKLDDDEIAGQGLPYDESEWFGPSYKFNSEKSENVKHDDDRLSVANQLADEKNNKIFESAAMNEFRVDGDRGEEFSNERNAGSPWALKPEQILTNIEYLESSLLLPSSAASIQARIKLLNFLRVRLFRSLHSSACRPLRDFRHFRHQIYLLHSSLSQSLNNTLNNRVNDVIDNDENKRQ